LKLLREILSYFAYLVVVTLAAMIFAAVWHDFIASFHLASHRSERPK